MFPFSLSLCVGLSVPLFIVGGGPAGPCGFPITAGVDANVFEPATGLLFVSTREGMIHIFHEDSPDKLREVETVKTEYGAKTMGTGFEESQPLREHFGF
jgi:hypothetical protein